MTEAEQFPHNPAHPTGTCADCGEELVHNVPRLGAAGGFVHKATGQLDCGSVRAHKPTNAEGIVVSDYQSSDVSTVERISGWDMAEAGKSVTVIEFPIAGIVIRLGEKDPTGARGGTIESRLHDGDDDKCPQWTAAANTVESFLLALACQGVDVSDYRVVNALSTTIDKIVEEYGEADTPEVEDEEEGELRSCPECHVMPGSNHKMGCDVERCPDCGGQAIGCACQGEYKHPRLPWTGIWPGKAECREFGWFERRIDGQWVRCEKDDSGAKEDLNRLGEDAVWDADKGRYVLP